MKLFEAFQDAIIAELETGTAPDVIHLDKKTFNALKAELVLIETKGKIPKSCKSFVMKVVGNYVDIEIVLESYDKEEKVH
jgi:hypothetical protein